MDLSITSRVLLIILGANVAAVLFMAVFYLIRGRRIHDRTGLEEYCYNLPKDVVINDNHVLVDGKWVDRESSSKPPSA